MAQETPLFFLSKRDPSLASKGRDAKDLSSLRSLALSGRSNLLLPRGIDEHTFALHGLAGEMVNEPIGVHVHSLPCT